jgi:hypothetical protein
MTEDDGAARAHDPSELGHAPLLIRVRGDDLADGGIEASVREREIFGETTDESEPWREIELLDGKRRFDANAYTPAQFRELKFRAGPASYVEDARS